MRTRLVVSRLSSRAAIGGSIVFIIGAVLIATYVPSLNPGTPPSAVLAETHQAEPKSVESAGVVPELYQGSFFYGTAREMLAALGVKVYTEDVIKAFPDPALRMGSQIKVYRAPVYRIKDGRQNSQVRSWQSTVQGLLDEQRIDVGEQDTVVPGLNTRLTSGAAIMITRVSETDVAITKPIEYSTKYQDDPTLERGKENVQQAGKNGVLKVTYHIRRENGVEVWRKETKQEVVQEPQARIVLRGTKIVSYGSGKASWYGGVGSMTAAHRTLPMGTMVRVVNTANGKSVTVRIADRGPFIAGRIIDLSKDAFAAIGSLGSGVLDVRVDKE